MSRKKNDINASSALAVIYARYSSSGQKEESIEQQVAECEKYAADNNLEVINVYADKAITGKVDRRPEFQKMIRHAEKRQFQIIIAYKSSRMARNMLHALAYEDRLEKYGVRVVYVKEEFGDSAAGRFALRTMMNVNQFYSENLAEDVRRGLIANAKNCKITNGTIPLGYRKGPDGKYEIDPHGAAVVREIFSRVAAGEKMVDIANDFNERQIKTSRGNEWNRSSFHRILKNERYTGIYIWDNIRIEGGIPQIISKELFWAVQKIISNKPGPSGRADYLLTGKLYCGKCKSHMVGVSGTGKSGKLFYYYVCQRKRREKACDKEPIRRDWIEREVAAAIREHIMQDEVIQWMADAVMEYAKTCRENSTLDMLESELAEAKKSIKNLVRAIEQGIITESTKQRLEELEAEQTRILGRIAIEKSNLILDITRDDVISALEAFRDGDVEDKKYQAALFRTFLVSVYLYDSTMKIVFNYTGKKKHITIPLNFDIDNVENPADPTCSYKLAYGAPIKKPHRKGKAD